MQYCANNTLRDYLDREERLVQSEIDLNAAFAIFEQIAKGLAYVHKKALIHRDLKPSNCFFMEDGTVKIGDFGLSRSLDQQQSDDDVDEDISEPRRFHKCHSAGDDITTGVGTHYYASPEQIASDNYDDRTDIYSLGIILFEMCHPPFSTGMERAIVLKELHEQRLPQGWPVQNEHPEVCDLIIRMLSKNPSERPSAEDVVQTITRLQGKQQVLGDRPEGSTVLRIEASREEVLTEAKAAIRNVSSQIQIVQYGWRGEADKGFSMMEFVLGELSQSHNAAVISAVNSIEGVRSVKKVR